MPRFLIVTLMFLAFTGVLPAQALKSVRPWMGVAIEDAKNGVLVGKVLPGTPAMEAGIQAGDVITGVNSTSVKSAKELIQFIAGLGVGHKVTVHFIRNTQKKKLTLTLVLKPDSTEMMKVNLSGKKAPPFELPEIRTGKNIALKSSQGKVTLLMFWATWCPACKATMPDLIKLAKSLPKKLQVLAISDESRDTQNGYFGKASPEFTALVDAENKVSGEYFVPGLPAFVVINQKGEVAQVGVGGGSYFYQVAEKVRNLAGNP